MEIKCKNCLFNNDSKCTCEKSNWHKTTVTGFEGCGCFIASTEYANKFIKNSIEMIVEDKDANMFDKITEEMAKTFRAKNKDYGNSFSEMFEEFGLTSSVIRLTDKYKRFKMLSSNEAKVKDESIEDTLLDMANYAIMTVMELRKQRTKE